VAFQQLAALLPPASAAAASWAAIQKLEAQGAEDAEVQAARLFAHTAPSWPEAALQARAPELLKRWCSHRDFAVREVGPLHARHAGAQSTFARHSAASWPRRRGCRRLRHAAPRDVAMLLSMTNARGVFVALLTPRPSRVA
jgi:hypothetical protein